MIGIFVLSLRGGNFIRVVNMPVIYLRLKNQSDNVYLQAILGCYSHLAWVRTEKEKDGLIKIITTDHLVDEAREVLRSLKEEIDFEEIEDF